MGRLGESGVHAHSLDQHFQEAAKTNRDPTASLAIAASTKIKPQTLDGPREPHLKRDIPQPNRMPVPRRSGRCAATLALVHLKLAAATGNGTTELSAVSEKRGARAPVPRRDLDEKLVFQRNHGLVVLAEGGDALQSALRFRHIHDRSVAVDRMAGGGEVPLPALAAVLDSRVGDGVGGWRHPGNGQRKQ